MFKWFWTVFSLSAFSLGVPDTFKSIFMFCEMLEKELLPNKRVELNLEIEFDGNLMMQINVEWLFLGIAIVCSADNLQQWRTIVIYESTSKIACY